MSIHPFSTSISPALGVHVAAWANPSSLLGAGLHPTQVASSSQGHISRQQPSTPTLTPADNFLLPVSLPCVSCARKPENLKRTTRRTCRKGPGGLASHASDSANGCGACSGSQRWGQRNTRCQFAVCGQFMPVTALQCSHQEGFWLCVCGGCSAPWVWLWFFPGTLTYSLFPIVQKRAL